MFRVGQKVEYINDDGGSYWVGDNRPVLNCIYTVRDVYLSQDLQSHGKPALRLVGLYNPYGPHGDECGFLASRFRPVVERKTDISIFTAMLKEDSHAL